MNSNIITVLIISIVLFIACILQVYSYINMNAPFSNSKKTEKQGNSKTWIDDYETFMQKVKTNKAKTK